MDGIKGMGRYRMRWGGMGLGLGGTGWDVEDVYGMGKDGTGWGGMG